MSGVKGRSGGKRANAGSKPKPIKDWQQRNLTVLQLVFTQEDVQAIAHRLRDAMKLGDKDAWKYLAYVFGATPKEVTVQGDPDQPIEMRITVARDTRKDNPSA